MKKVRVGLALAVVILFSAFTSMAFALTADSVLSHDIKEADGTSAQNTNSGSGIKTGHIQDAAVTTNKIADGAVTDTKIADSAVSSAKIANNAVTTGKVADGSITTNKLIDSAITTGKIADGAVTDAKITGPISASKISSTGLNADTVDGVHAADLAPSVHTHSQSQVTGLEAALAGKSDVTHNHDALYQQKYGKVAIVAQTGGHYTDPISAMNDLTVWCGIPSVSNQCLLKLMPGIYNIGGDTLYMLPYVTVEGSGQNITKISSQPQIYSVVISPYGSDGAALHSLTIENRNSVPVSGTRLTGIWIESDNFTIEDVKIIVSGSTQYPNYNNAVMVAGGWWGPRTTVIKNSTLINTTGSGIEFEYGETVKISNSDIMGGYRAVGAYLGTAYIVNTKLDGGQGNWFSSSSKCIGVYDGNYNPIVCP